MGIVLVRTYKHTQYPYLYTCAAFMFASAGTNVLEVILYNWVAFCDNFYAQNDKCHDEPTADWVANVTLFNNLCSTLAVAFYYNGHFLFAYRYFEVAEMFGRDDQSQAKHEINRGVTRKISYVCVAIISLNSLIYFANKGIYRRITSEYSHTLYNWTDNIMPGVFLLGFCVLLLISIVWICHSLKHDKHLKGNEKWMAVHFVLLTLVLGSYIWGTFFANG
jgi:hypothetical protein